mgnify:CR=1 FL=1
MKEQEGKESWQKERRIPNNLRRMQFAAKRSIRNYPYQAAASNLNVSISALKSWIKKAKENDGEVPTRGAGNYSSDEAKEIARLQRELRDTKDALEVLKKAIGILEN